MRAGIEVGGTFTDLVAFDGGRVQIGKVPSTPASPDAGAFSVLVAAGIAPATITDLVHGSTVATNAILERKGARLAFVTTKGFRDILFLQRHDRRNIYDLRYEKPRPPVDRRDCFEVDERLSSSGQVVRSLDQAEIERSLIPALNAGAYQAAAICLLSAYASAVHEQRLKQLIAAALPALRIACSHEITREFREFERATTTVLSAYVQPVIDGYLDRFEATLAQAGFRGRFSVMQSNGGRLPAVAMRRNSITALFSGPAAGVVGAIRQAGRSGYKNLITFDMGGTSTDVSLVTDGKPALAPETEVDGLPIRTPVLDIVSIGAGGGSLIWMDEGGMLRVGPRSAGAEPGPACYGRGGVNPTVTDAHLVRGTIRADAFLGGAMPLFADRACAAFTQIAHRLGTDVVGAANAAIRLTVANIVRAIQLVSTERGKDPRAYSLLPFGGAGPLVACEIAEELGIPEIIVPPNPGVVSALGLLSADFLKVAGATCRTNLDDGAPSLIREEFARFQANTESEFRELGLDGELDFSLIADMRFAGQAFEIPVEIDPAVLPRLRPSDLAERFTEAHRRMYFHGGEAGRRVELVCLRLGVRRRLDALPDFRERAGASRHSEIAEVRSAAGVVRARLVDAAALKPEEHVEGPALIEGYSSTTWIPKGWTARRDAHEESGLKLDPVDYAIVSQALIAAAREMGVKLVRSAYSTVLREARDGSAALLDAQGNTVAQAELIPMQLGTIGYIFQACARLYPVETLREGDFFAINDPYSGGQHLQDVFFFHPIFLDGRVLGFSASVAHHLDLGGGSAGLNPLAGDVYAEGLIIPPLKLNMQRDWQGGWFERMLRANVRVPHQTMGDFDAQMAANAMGAVRILELVERYGLDVVTATMAALQDYSEARMRAAIAQVPDGVYVGEDAVDDDGDSDTPLVVRSTVTVKGNSIAINFAGTAPQVRKNLNAPFASTVSAALSCIKAALTSPDIPFNAGSARPIQVTAPKGSLLNPYHPAPVRARMEACNRAWNATMKALAQAVPHKVVACGFDTTTALVLSKLQNQGWSVCLEICGGGWGAAADKDGCDGVDTPLSNCSNTPVEALDQDFGFFRVVEYALRPDSCGVGEMRGGLGFVRSYEILEEGVQVALYSDRFRRAPEGLFGGGAGTTGFCRIKRGDETIELRSKDMFALRKGDVLTIGLGGGGAYGDPVARPEERIREDVAQGLISEAFACRWRTLATVETVV